MTRLHAKELQTVRIITWDGGQNSLWRLQQTGVEGYWWYFSILLNCAPVCVSLMSGAGRISSLWVYTLRTWEEVSVQTYQNMPWKFRRKKCLLVSKNRTGAGTSHEDNSFDFVISITLHNLHIYDLKKAVQHIQRVSKGNSYIVVESYRNEVEKANLLYWQLTCECFYTPAEWEWLFDEWGYTGDYGFYIFWVE